jgi:hypothetical protein
MAPACTVADLLPEHTWRQRAQAHRDRVDAFTAGHRERAASGAAHPVWDFMFTYYSLRPRQLRIWHPGYGAVLAGAAADGFLRRSGYVASGGGVGVGEDFLHTRLPAVRFIAGLLRSTAGRAPQFGCFGLHEWAMVYRAPATRHGQVPLRLGVAGTEAVVESSSLRCSHYDAYRFFTPEAAPRNSARLTRRSQPDAEQPGCLHATMDLYKCRASGGRVTGG